MRKFNITPKAHLHYVYIRDLGSDSIFSGLCRVISNRNQKKDHESNMYKVQDLMLNMRTKGNKIALYLGLIINESFAGCPCDNKKEITMGND